MELWFTGFINLALSLMLIWVNENFEIIGLVMTIIVYPIMIWFYVAQHVKRCHDMGHSGWFMLIPFYIFFLYFLTGQEDDNKYGEALIYW